MVLAAPFTGLPEEEVGRLLRARKQIETRTGKTAQADDWMFLQLCRRFREGHESLADLIERLGWINAKDRDRGKTGIQQIRCYWEQRQLLDYIEECYRANKPCEILILKSRQLGMTTVIQIAFIILDAIMPNSRSLTVAHKDDVVEYIRDTVAKFALSRMHYPPDWKPSRGKILFPATWRGGDESEYRVESAQSFEPGRAMNFRFIHLSEAAFYPNDYDFIAGVTATLPEEGFYILVQETTAKGPAGQFYDAWVASQQSPPKNDYKAFFFPWWSHHRYRTPVTPKERKRLLSELTDYEQEGIEAYGWEPEQIMWRRRRVATRYSGREELMMQEHPSCWEEAFLNAGRAVFDRQVLMYDQQRLESVHPVFRGQLLEVIS